MKKFNCGAMLFDLDGVLVDSTRSVERQWRLWAQENNLDPDKIMEIAHGRRTVEVVRLAMPHLDAEAEVPRLEKREAEDTEGVMVMAGAADLLARIPRERWCVVTSGTRLLATARLKLGKLPLPDVLVTAEDVTDGKPHPEPYLKGAELLGFDPSQCLVIEDAPAGIRAAHAAGMRAIGLASTFAATELSEADAVIESLRSLMARVNGGELEISLS
jgi:sugar-phosphatase